MKVILITLISAFYFSYTGIQASSIYAMREQELREIRRSCTQCIAETDECITRDQLTVWHTLGSRERKQLQDRLINNLINSDNLIKACILVDTHKLQMEIDKPFFEHDNGYCWLLDAQLSFYNSMHTLIQLYIKRVRRHFNKYRASCTMHPFRVFH